jgi:iron complex transport system substrate-binding protein
MKEIQMNTHFYKPTDLTDTALNRLEFENLTRRRFITAAGGLALGVLTGCGSEDQAAAPTATVAATRIFAGPAGPVEFPANPQRVIPGYTTDVDIALVLDLPLVGVPGARGGAQQALASYHPKEKLGSVAKVTTSPEPNLEQIAALQPDLILDSYPYQGFEDRYQRFSQIAPTLNFGAEYGTGWRPYLRAAAAALGREASAEAFIARYEARVVELRARGAERWPGARVAFITSFEPGTVYLEAGESQPARILRDDLGLLTADAVPATFAEEGNISLEELNRFDDADLVIVRVDLLPEGESRDREVLDVIRRSPLWLRLPAVAKGQVYEYDAELYYDSPLSAMAFLDVVEQKLLAS